MIPETGLIALIAITLMAAVVNGALGYGFSSLTVPVALLFHSNRVLNPAVVLVEAVLNAYMLFVNWSSVPKVWRRVMPILLGLVPGILIGSYVLSMAHPEWLKLFTYAVLLPLILLQAAGVRRPIRSERILGVPFGTGVGVLYSVTTISGPPLALFFNNQGFAKAGFRAALSLVRVVESAATATTYYLLDVHSGASVRILLSIVPSVAIGVPIGAYLIRRVNAETFRRICMSFDVWVVGFGLSRVLTELGFLSSPMAYSFWLAVILLDGYLMYGYFSGMRRALRSPWTVESPDGDGRVLWERTPVASADDQPSRG